MKQTINSIDYIESRETIVHACGHKGRVVSRCAEAYRQRYCDKCSEALPKPSECLRRFMSEHNNVDDFGPMLGPIGAVIYARQNYFNLRGMLAWSGTESMHDAIDEMEPSRKVTLYIERFAEAGL